LLDTQFVTDHLRSFGAIEVPRQRYRSLLDDALQGFAAFDTLPVDQPVTGAKALEIIAAH
jgi:leucyl/phenylalanyl-tRNA--protein transferase